MTKKFGKVKGEQRYKCHNCNKQFIDKLKPDKVKMWDDYVSGKQTYEQLSDCYKISTRTVQRYLESVSVKAPIELPRSIVAIMDTTYFGRVFGLNNS